MTTAYPSTVFEAYLEKLRFLVHHQRLLVVVAFHTLDKPANRGRVEGRHTLDWMLFPAVLGMVYPINAIELVKKEKYKILYCATSRAGFYQEKQRQCERNAYLGSQERNLRTAMPLRTEQLIGYLTITFEGLGSTSAKLRKCNFPWGTSKVKSALTDRSNCAAIKPFFGLVRRCLAVAEIHRTHNLLCKRVDENMAKQKKKSRFGFDPTTAPAGGSTNVFTCSVSSFPAWNYENDVITDCQDFDGFLLCHSRPWNSRHRQIR